MIVSRQKYLRWTNYKYNSEIFLWNINDDEQVERGIGRKKELHSKIRKATSRKDKLTTNET